jgi:hypothetical protein
MRRNYLVTPRVDTLFICLENTALGEVANLPNVYGVSVCVSEEL